jgi:hypothetical protein
VADVLLLLNEGPVLLGQTECSNFDPSITRVGTASLPISWCYLRRKKLYSLWHSHSAPPFCIFLSSGIDCELSQILESEKAWLSKFTFAVTIFHEDSMSERKNIPDLFRGKLNLYWEKLRLFNLHCWETLIFDTFAQVSNCYNIIA